MNRVTLLLLALSFSACSSRFPGFKSLGLGAVFSPDPYTNVTPVDSGPESEARLSYMLGEIALAKGDSKLAKEFFEEAISNSAGTKGAGGSPTVHKRLAQLLLTEGKLDLALEHIELVLSELKEQKDSLDERQYELMVECVKIRAGILVAKGNAAEAILAYQSLIKNADKLPPTVSREELYIMQASLYLQNKEQEAAKQVIMELLKREPRSFLGYYYLAKIEESAGNKEASIKLLERAVSSNPQNEQIALELARAYAAANELDKAIKLVERVLQNDTSSVDARDLLGQLFLAKNDSQSALKQFDMVSQYQADPSRARIKVAIIKLQQKEFAGAEEQLALVLAQHPDWAQARYYMGLTLANMNRFEESLTQLSLVEPGDEFALESRRLKVMVLRSLGRNDQARETLESMLQDSPNDVELLAYLAGVERGSKNYDRAIDLMNKVIELEPNSDQHHFTIGVLYDDAKLKTEAYAAMRRAIELNPKNASALNYLGYSFADSGQNLEEAEQLVKRALELDPDSGYYLDSLGWVYYQQGKYDLAQKTLRKAIALVKSDAVLWEHLAEVQIKLGQLTEAKESVGRALELAPSSDDKDCLARVAKLAEQLNNSKQVITDETLHGK